MVKVSVPGRICLFGEHQDYLGLEVIASAIGLYFTATATPRRDNKVNIRVRDEKCSQLNDTANGKFKEFSIPLGEELSYNGKKDYFKAVVNVLTRKGIELHGADILMEADVPIEKGMGSSTAMVMSFMGALAAVSGKRLTPAELAHYAWEAEVQEFGGNESMKDQYTAALGGIVHLDFSSETKAELLPTLKEGCFLLFDSLSPKDVLESTTSAKGPSLTGMRVLQRYGAHSIRDIDNDPGLERQILRLPAELAAKVRANLDNYRLEQKALNMLTSGHAEPHQLGNLLNREQLNLKIGLGVSTPVIDRALEAARAMGAYGGKINGTGGGGCFFVYAPEEKADKILASVSTLGLPGRKISISDGVRFEKI